MQMRVLLVDDNPKSHSDLNKKIFKINQELERTREIISISTLTATTGQEAAELYKEHKDSGKPIHIVLMEFHLKQNDAAFGAVSIFNCDEKANIIAYSYDTPALIEQTIKLAKEHNPELKNTNTRGLKHNLPKPCSFEDICQLVAKCFANASIRMHTVGISLMAAQKRERERTSPFASTAKITLQTETKETVSAITKNELPISSLVPSLLLDSLAIDPLLSSREASVFISPFSSPSSCGSLSSHESLSPDGITRDSSPSYSPDADSKSVRPSLFAIKNRNNVLELSPLASISPTSPSLATSVQPKIIEPSRELIDGVAARLEEREMKYGHRKFLPKIKVRSVEFDSGNFHSNEPKKVKPTSAAIKTPWRY